MGVETGDKKDLGPALDASATDEPPVTPDGDGEALRRRRRRGMRVPSDDVPRPQTGPLHLPAEPSAPAPAPPPASAGGDDFDLDVDVDDTPFAEEPVVQAAEIPGVDLAEPEDVPAVVEPEPEPEDLTTSVEEAEPEPEGAREAAASPPPPPLPPDEHPPEPEPPPGAVAAPEPVPEPVFDRASAPIPRFDAAPIDSGALAVEAAVAAVGAAAESVSSDPPLPAAEAQPDAPASGPADEAAAPPEELELSSLELEEEQLPASSSLPPPPPPRAVEKSGPTKVPPVPPKRVAAASAEPDRAAKKRRTKAWFEEIFDEDYLRTLPFLTPKTTQREAAFLIEALGLKPGQHVLDIGCGYGRHAMELAGRGHVVTAVDLSLPLLLRGADEAQRRGLNINFVHGDMRELAYEGVFDGAYCVFSTFGYFDDDANKRAAAGFARALKPGARLVLDLLNRDYIISDLPTRVWWEGDGCVVLEEVDFNYFTSRLVSARSIVFDDGRQVEQEISIRSYSLHEVGKLLHGAGFRVISVSGGLAARGRFFGKDSRQIIVVAERRAEAAARESSSIPTVGPASFPPAQDPGNGKA
jgi:SAM-dependent methyltransferase